MNYYLEIKLLPDKEVALPFLRNKIYTKLHKAIYNLRARDIGISFPQEKNKLGCIIYIHSIKSRLEELQTKTWLGGLSGYCKISEILPVPDKVTGYQTFSRIRQTMTDAKLKKRVAYQKSIGVLDTDSKEKDYIKQYKNKMFSTGLDNPYLELQSTSTSEKYRLYISFGDLQKTATKGKFNHFGLSKITTVPVF